ncbi:MAG: alpha/beta fold hydrolase [Nitrospirae bacterium]|nr:MAG: alpha/beta fold hydrolase [Nitrospirota bacterium]
MRVSVRGINLGYTDEGHGEPLVFIHAFPLSRIMWEPQREALASRYRVINIDLRGHGESDSILWHFTLDDYAEDVVALVQHLHIERATFVGLSMGGYILFSLYRRRPELIKALVLADTRAQADSEEAKAGRMALAQVAYRKGMSAVADQMLPKLLAPGSLKTRPELVERIRSIILNNDPAGTIVDLMAMAERPDSTPLLASVTCPTLVIVGEDDIATPPSEAHYMVDRLPQSKLITIPGAGHLSNIEQPERFTQALMDFVSAR